MGSVTAVNLNQVINLYNLDIFVETGLLHGDGVLAAMAANFKSIYSMDINEDYCKAFRDKIWDTDTRVSVYHGDSVSVLLVIHPWLNGNVFWWLDAHLPALYGKPEITDVELVYPLIYELEFISNNRDCSGDVFLLDDGWLYADIADIMGVSANLYQKDVELLPVLRYLLPDHSVYINRSEQGYVLVFPRKDGVPDGFCVGWDCLVE